MEINNFEHLIFGKSISKSNNLRLKEAKEWFSVENLRNKSNIFRDIPIDDILTVLQRTGEIIADPKAIYYKKCIDELPELINYSPSMVKKGLKILKFLLSREFLISRLSCLKSYYSLDHFTHLKNRGYCRAMPVGSICHIAAGNVFLGSVDSLIYGIITKNINVLKASSQDLIFPAIFFKALEKADIDKIIYPFCSLTYWSRDNSEVKDYIKTYFDAILLFGSENAVIEYKNGLSSKCELYSFGPKISFSIITSDLDDQQLKNAAKGLAVDIVMWEQRACTSCQNIFIEDTGQSERFAEYLLEELEIQTLTFPQTKIDIDSLVEIRKERELTRWKEFQNSAKIFEGKNGFHTIIVSNSNDIIDSPLNRTVFINKINNYDDIFKGNINLMKYYMSTLSISSVEKAQKITEDFMKAGIMRFCKPGTMSLGIDGSAPHDGVFIPLKLVKLIDLEDLPIESYSTTFLDINKKDRILLSRLNSQLLNSIKSPFYSKFYSDYKLKLNSLEDFKNIPILEKKHLEENCPPKNLSMLTDKPRRSYIFSAGGTTGSVKNVYYTAEEFYRSEICWGEGFKAVGIDYSDRTANFLRAGALWTAFPATNLGLEETDCTILSLTANQPYSKTLDYLDEFNVTAILSVSAELILLAETAFAEGRNLNIKKIFYTGEHLSDSSWKFLEKTFNPEYIRSLGYAAVEVGPIGFQCQYCEKNEFHIFDLFNYVEINDDGNILVTTLDRKLHPLIRYKLGDLAEFISDKCKCGRTASKIKLLSRSDNMIKFNFAKLYLKDIFTSLEQYPKLSSIFQIIVEPVGSKLALKILIETTGGKIDLEEELLEKKIKQSILDNSQEIKTNWNKLLIENFKIVLCNPGSIERVSRTGKVKRIIDKRIK